VTVNDDLFNREGASVISEKPEHWDRICDVVVLGSGAAGLAAATTASDAGAQVLVLEKASLIGGTAGVSGGIIWAPVNRLAAQAGLDDTREEALTYIRRLTLGREPDPELVEVFVDRASEAIAYLEERTPLKLMVSEAFTDYYADLPGGKRGGGRSLEPRPFDARTELGPWAAKLRTSPHMARLTMAEGATILQGGEIPGGLAEQRERDDVRVLGPGLVAALFRGLLDRGVEVQTDTRALDLVVVDRRVIGVRCEHDGESELIAARRGVILACGGFEWNAEMVRAFIGEPIEPMSPPHNEGDGHRMAMEAGAALANMTAFWGQPALHDPEVEFEGHRLIQMGGSRAFPGVIVVNRAGRRFVNEAVSYQDFPKVVGAYDPVAVDHPNEDHWMIFDQTVKDRATILPSVPPGAAAPEWILRADTVRDLATQAGIDADGLQETVKRWNESVSQGDDPQFHRGTLWYEAFMSGGPQKGACLGPVSTGPFYAARLVHGALGTSGGARIDADGRVRNMRGGFVDGLYAAGTVSASVLGDAYPGGGATLGPALTFGYLAGLHAGAQPSLRLDETAAVGANV
jgi:3-oxosteroid 1-dehydrogenase